MLPQITRRSALLEEYEQLKIKKLELTKQRTKYMSILYNNKSTNDRDYPIILGNANTRMSVLDLGTLPSPNTENFKAYFTTTNIFPINFKAKRRFNNYKSYANKTPGDNKQFYICEILEGPRFLIRSADKREWDDWNEFVKEFDDMWVADIVEFFGLTHPALIKMIEELGDVNIFEGYVPINKRA